MKGWREISNSTVHFLKKILFIYFQTEGKGERKRWREKNQCVVASCVPPTGDLAHNPGMCSHRELNLSPFGLQTGTQSTEPYQPGPVHFFLKVTLEKYTCLQVCLFGRMGFSCPPFYHLSLFLVGKNIFSFIMQDLPQANVGGCRKALKFQGGTLFVLQCLYIEEF